MQRTWMRVSSSARMTRSRMMGAASRLSSHVLWSTCSRPHSLFDGTTPGTAVSMGQGAVIHGMKDTCDDISTSEHDTITSTPTKPCPQRRQPRTAGTSQASASLGISG